MPSTISSAMTSAVAYPMEIFAERYAVFLPWYEKVLVRLEIQEWAVYYTALHACTKDSWKALVSTYQLWYLILRPPTIVAWIVLQHTGRFVGEHGGKSLQSLAIQTKNLAIWCVRFQLSLNKVQLLGEAGFVAMVVGLYYLRKWLQRQTYWARMVTYYKAKKRTAIRSITDFFDRLARVSKILALIIPHLIFVGLCVAVHLAFPGAVRYVTYETPVLWYLSVVYPFISTFLWIRNQRRSKRSIANGTSSDCCNKDENENDDGSNGMSVSERKKKFERENKIGEKSAPEFINETNAMATTRYWLNYWQVYAIVQGVGRCFSMTPIVGRFLISHPIFHFFTGECKLFFFVWVFGMEKILGSATSASGDSFMVEALPLRLIQTYATPMVLKMHALVSDAIPRDLWQKWVVSKTKTSLDLAVLVRALSEERRDWLVHVTEEARVLTLPSITLLMPGFVTQFGVAYVRYAIPSAKSALAKSKTAKLVYLQYWVLHCCVAGLLAYLEGILWWIPFSTHAVFLMWCYLILPQAISYIYGMLESDLVAFGLLPKVDDSQDATISINETKIARLFDWVVSRLPAANAVTSSDEKDADDNAEEEDNQSIASDSQNSSRTDKTTEANVMEQLISNGSDITAGNVAKDKDV
mmetsp:Transcript_17480/g.48270  ORF Transcript_17480/g.48270 Transcript_17480/m.48270 type:complete len:639 (-) Transcript_17480:386-2302(-)|eukprot:CAMPEP_0172372044 /NCGR_PEP_ID=MMETSP1060-20121228/45733_1 /TAXON_ID=37318 /ORGANISM="Pseudo-nitzschia pungens, Strain cf. cingulata" /LENGTH=638 /DNA_ID=CAMNT_0013097859 /DNA_START=316 /DNA_END=2232 /DNA_ORIENTATION=-